MAKNIKMNIINQRHIRTLTYSHYVMEQLFQNVRDEIVGNLKTKYKETDLFKLYQTTDLANIDSSQPELSKKLPSLLKLRNALYSKEFREFVSKVTGCQN